MAMQKPDPYVVCAYAQDYVAHAWNVYSIFSHGCVQIVWTSWELRRCWWRSFGGERIIGVVAPGGGAVSRKKVERGAMLLGYCQAGVDGEV